MFTRRLEAMFQVIYLSSTAVRFPAEAYSRRVGKSALLPLSHHATNGVNVI